MRHIIEIIGILSATTVYYQELKSPRVTAVRRGRLSLDLINTPIGWAFLITISFIVSLPAYLYFLKQIKRRSLPHTAPQPFRLDLRYRPLKIFLVFLVCFYLTYKQ